MWKRQGSTGISSTRSEEHTSELQSRLHLVCRLLLEKKKKHRFMPSNVAIPTTSNLLITPNDTDNPLPDFPSHSLSPTGSHSVPSTPRAQRSSITTL